MSLANRVQKLERTEDLIGPRPVVERFQRALDNAAFRLTSKDFKAISADSAIVQLIMDDLQESFTQKLSDADLDELIAALKRNSGQALSG